MLQILRKTCFCVGVTGDVDIYCRQCERCTVAMPLRIRIQSPTENLLTSKPFEIVAVDFILL